MTERRRKGLKTPESPSFAIETTIAGLGALDRHIRRYGVGARVIRLVKGGALSTSLKGSPSYILLPGQSWLKGCKRFQEGWLPATTAQLTVHSPYLRADQFGYSPVSRVATVTDGHFWQTAGPSVNLIVAFGKESAASYLQRKGEKSIIPIEQLGGRADSVWLKKELEALVNQPYNPRGADSVQPMIGFWENNNNFFTLRAGFVVGPGYSLAEVMGELTD